MITSLISSLPCLPIAVMLMPMLPLNHWYVECCMYDTWIIYRKNPMSLIDDWGEAWRKLRLPMRIWNDRWDHMVVINSYMLSEIERSLARFLLWSIFPCLFVLRSTYQFKLQEHAKARAHVLRILVISLFFILLNSSTYYRLNKSQWVAPNKSIIHDYKLFCVTKFNNNGLHAMMQ